MKRLITSLRLIQISIGTGGTLYPGYEILTEQLIPEESLEVGGEFLSGSL